MTGIIITDPGGEQTYRDLFYGSEIKAEWVHSPAGLDMVKADFIMDLSFIPETGRLESLSNSQAPLILLNSVSRTLQSMELDDRFARINGWNTFLQRPLVEVVVPEPGFPLLEKFCNTWSKPFELLKDTPGMPSARIVSMIINEAFFALGQEVSTTEAIDTAMKLGTNYPYGPFEWCTLIGPAAILTLLETLFKENPRYTIAPLLREQARHPYGFITKY